MKPQSDASSTAVGSAKEIYQFLPEKRYEGLKPGAIAPDAVQVDADKIESIVDGVLIIAKGNLHAMIDLKGHFIKDWDAFTYTSSTPFSTLIGMKTQFGSGYINIKGEFVVPLIYAEVGSFDAHRLATVAIKHTRKEFQINLKGQVVSEETFEKDTDPRERNEFDLPQSDLINTSKGYFNTKGKLVLLHTQFILTPFTDGMAAVAIQDQFGKIKWGYINESGKLVIPYIFNKTPGTFHDGFALVEPIQRGSFNYAYIDKTGKVRFTVGNGELFQPYHPGRNGYFVNGYAMWNYGDNDVRLLDTLGDMHTVTEIIKRPELEFEHQVGIDYYNELGFGVYLLRAGNASNTHGLVNLQGHYLFPPAFWQLTPDYFTPYALAETFIQKQNNTVSSIHGIVNRQGVYVLVLKPKSEF